MAADDDDPFCLDFTKLSTSSQEPSAPAASVAPAVPVASIASAPVKTQTASSAFEAFKAPLELVDISATTPPAATAITPPVPPTPPQAAPAPGQLLVQEIARLHAAGKTQEASTQLEAALRAGKLGNATEQGWGMLFDLLQILNRRQAFETLADAYAKRFEKSAPAWIDATGHVDDSLATGGAAYVALSGTLSAASEGALKKLIDIAGSNPTVRLGLLKVTDADNDGCGHLLTTLRAIKKLGRECLLSGADELAVMLAGKVEMMRREREETWLLLLELYLRAGNQVAFEDTAVGYAVTFEVSPPSWETPPATKSTAKAPAIKPRDPFVLEGELLAGMGSINALVEAAKGRDAITIETDHLARIDEISARNLLDALTPLHASGLHIRLRGANLLVATLLQSSGLDKIATIETRRR